MSPSASQPRDGLAGSAVDGTERRCSWTASPDTPCINVGDFVDGKFAPKRSKDDGFTYRFNAQWKPQKD